MTPAATTLETDRIAHVLSATHLGKEVTSPDGPLAILKDINLSIERAEAVAIIGPSGSGKTTLLALLAGLDAPTRGEVRLFGQALAGLDEDMRAGLRAGRVGFVFQDFNLLPRLTAEENVRIAAELGNADNADTAAKEALNAVGLGTRAHHFPSTLSGGEQQRVAIARAFAPRPELLFADEPTGNLDTSNGERIIDLLFSLQAEHHTTLILATHDERLARRCSRQFILESGTLARA
ncbi:MAG: ATP-binding cassette domain-containing protein [Gammaproteobacteria bacterium]